MDSKVYSGRIVKSTNSLYTVRLSDESAVQCRAKGSFKHEKTTLVAGDLVEFELGKDGYGFITRLFDRKNFLIRPAASNIDILVIVVACTDPEPDLFVLDKLTAVAKYNEIDVVIVFNKNDIKSADELENIYNKAGFKTFSLSAKNTEQNDKMLDNIRKYLSGKVSFFAGASGVGKSTLINALYPWLMLQTGEISKKIQRGKHTTRCTVLYSVDKDGTYIADTPGFSMLDVAGFNLLTLEGLLPSFEDVEKHSHGCKYKGCTHICEDGCSVMDSVKNGDISPSRHESFKNLYNELKQIKPWDN